jgi:hypothetical protein
MTNGGGFMFSNERGYIDEQIGRMSERAAHRFVTATAFGGHTTSEAFEILADADARPYGTAAEVVDPASLPDRWFRNAWRRSPNGGPIRVDFRSAQILQADYIATAVTLYNEKQRRVDLLHALSGKVSGLAPIVLDTSAMRQRIREAQSLEQLRVVWPAARPLEYRTVSVSDETGLNRRTAAEISAHRLAA